MYVMSVVSTVGSRHSWDNRWESIPVNTSLYFTMWGYLDIPQVMLIHSHSTYALFIGVETGEARGARAPPIHVFYPHDFINIHACSADCRNRRVYYVWPPQNGIASYAYAIAKC